MKTRFLLFLLGAACLAGSAQSPRHLSGIVPKAIPVLCPEPATPDGVLNQSVLLPPGFKPAVMTQVGNTWYDTQTYNAGNLMSRLYQHPDKTIGAVWMHKGETGTPDRGSAYNYFDGSGWGVAENHLGNDPNNGFPSYAPWGPTGEIIAHYQYLAGEGSIKLLRRAVKGQGTWDESILYPPAGNYSIVWHSMITSGTNHQYVHILALVYDDPYMGLDDAVLYYRSPDGGVTWDKQEVTIPGLDSSFFTTNAGLRYQWAQPVGNTIAFTYGFDHFDGLVFKSQDNGDTWEKITVYDAPYDPHSLPDITETYGCGDGTSAIALDSEGKVHVAFGRMLTYHDIITSPPGGWYFYPGTEGMIYWNETMPPLDSAIISTYTLEYLIQGGNLVGWTWPDTVVWTYASNQPNYGVGLTSMPQLGIDADNNLYLAWSALCPTNDNGEFHYRHIYTNASMDGGSSWTGIKDLTSDFVFFISECVFPAVSPLVDDSVHVLFQEDYTPGTGSGEENRMIHIAEPKDYFVGMKEPATGNSLRVSPAFPNPASGYVQFILTLDKPARVTVSVFSLTGQLVRQADIGQVNPGSRNVSLGLEGLDPGIYFYSVSADAQQAAGKLVVGQ